MTATAAPPTLGLRLRPWLLGCAVLSALSLLLARQPTYDPAAWLIWGRMITEGTLSTGGGPSWKPLSVMLTAPYALLGDTAAQLLWMWTARFGGLASLVLAYALTRRLGGDRAASLVAAGALVLAIQYAYNFARGDSEGLLVAAVFAGALAFLDGRVRLALLFGVLAALIRPEVGPWLLLLGIWMLRRPDPAGPAAQPEPEEERRRRAAARRRLGDLALLTVAAAGLVAAWTIPEQFGSGSGLRAATRAQLPVDGSPASTAFPFGMTFLNAVQMLVWPVYLGALARVHAAWRARRHRAEPDRAVLWIALGASLAMLQVALASELGISGNLRYVTLAMCGVCVLGGLGLPPLVRRAAAWPRTPRIAAALLAGAAVLAATGSLGWQGARLARTEGRYGPQLAEILAAAGGPAAVRACAPLAGSPYERQILAWRLRVDPATIATHAVATDGTLMTLRPTVSPLPLRARAGDWQLRSACG